MGKPHQSSDDAVALTPGESGRRVNDVDYVRRDEALAMLGIKKESLYTYVSRGLIKTLTEPGRRTSLYRKSDLEKLSTRVGAKGGGAPVAQSLRYGEPVVQTSICEISTAGPRYRGQPATTLAREGRSLEYVADLLWGGLPPARDRPWPVMEDESAEMRGKLVSMPQQADAFSPIRVLAMAALQLSALEAAGDARGHGDARVSGLRLINAFSGISGYFGPDHAYATVIADEFVAWRVLRGFGLAGRPDADQLLAAINAALVLSVDNELSAPTFCARISSSTGVDMYACVASALMAQAGPMQAGGMMDLEQYLAEVLCADRPMAYTGVPCFGHPLYDRDPRAELLLEMVRDLSGAAATRERLLEFVDAVHRRTGAYPNLFAALVILAYVLGLPAGAAVYLHCLGRTAGWVAHAAEQRLSGVMLRPRARYVGARPAGSF